MRLVFRAYRAFLILITAPMILGDFLLQSRAGGRRLGWLAKMALMFKMIRNNVRIVTGSNFLEHMIMAQRIMAVPADAEGCVVECGSYKGGSTANLSLACGLAGRDLEVFDSFEGLPEPVEVDAEHLVLDRGEYHTYTRGEWKGTLEEVEGNLRRFGEIDRCRLNKGFFDATLPGFDKSCVFVFLDVDLRESMETCLRHLWPRLSDGCALFTHEAPHLEVASLFFDREWWRANLASEPPGLIAAGSGLGLVPDRGGFRSALGYTIKNPEASRLRVVPQITE